MKTNVAISGNVLWLVEVACKYKPFVYNFLLPNPHKKRTLNLAFLKQFLQTAVSKSAFLRF